MLLPSFKRLQIQDYPQEFKDLIEKLSFVINNGIEILYEALNKKVSLKDNIYCTLGQVEVEVDASGIPKKTSILKLDINARIIGVQILKAENLTNSATYPITAPFVSFQQNTNTLIITHVSGLQANNNYRLTIVAYG